MADKKVAITCEGFKARRQEGNGFEKDVLKDVPGLQEIELELEQGNEPVYADGVKKFSLFSGITGATLTTTLMELSKEERQMFLGIKVENGMEIYASDAVPPYVSASWKYRCSDGSYIHYGLVRGNFNIPNTSASTMEDSPEQQDQIEMEGSFMQRSSKDKTVYVRIHDGDPEFPGEDAFLKFVHGDDAIAGGEENTGGTTEQPTEEPVA
ncbi:major tail protein [Staphylococcus gallinarum]|uniref:major tail protein n=1 Tax=Staphylococcus gallinarum TaxID=1293 RepID=UPI003175E8F9